MKNQTFEASYVKVLKHDYTPVITASKELFIEQENIIVSKHVFVLIIHYSSITEHVVLNIPNMLGS